MAREVHGPEYDPSTEDLAWWISHHDGGRRQEAWAVLDWRWRNRLGCYSQSLPDSSK
jgi:hypothetical protein